MKKRFLAKQKKTIDVNPEFMVQNCGNGIKIIPPSPHQFKSCSGSGNHLPTTTVGNLLNLPVNVYFLNTESILQETNIPNALSCGFDSYSDAIGRSTREIPASQETIQLLLLNDQKTMTTRKTIAADESGIIKKCVVNLTSIKIPWYDEYEKIIGVFGFSIPYGNHFTPNLLGTFQAISHLGILNSSALSSLTNNENPYDSLKVRLSRREQECIFYLKQGKSIKRIAQALDLSSRTVRHYIDSIKIKFNVTYTTELIEILLQ